MTSLNGDSLGSNSLSDLQCRKLAVLELLSGMTDTEVQEIKDIINRRCPLPVSNAGGEHSRGSSYDQSPPHRVNSSSASLSESRATVKRRKHVQTNDTPPSLLNIPALMSLPSSLVAVSRQSSLDQVKMKRKQPGDSEDLKKLSEVVRPLVSMNVLRNLTSPEDVRAKINKLKVFGVKSENKSVEHFSFWNKVKDEDKMDVFLKTFASSLDDGQMKKVISGSSSADEPAHKKTKKKQESREEGNSNDKVMPDEVYAQYRRLINLRKQRCLSRPKLRLTQLGEKSSLSVVDGSRVPLGLNQVQHLILFAILRDKSPGNCPASFGLRKPGNVRKTLFLVVDGASLLDYETHRETLTQLSSMPVQIEVAMPSSSEDEVVENALTDISTLRLTEGEVKRLNVKYGSMEKAMQDLESLLLLRSIFPIKVKEKKDQNKSGDEPEKKNEDRFPRTELLMTPWQMVEHGYPVRTDKKYSHFKYTKDSYRPVTAESPMWALDCEMCATQNGQELTRVSIINENMEVMYDSLVKPPSPIVNYLTQYSGITPSMLKNVTTTLEVVQEDIRRMLPSDCILVGQSLSCDLIALKMMHPYIIDTSVIFNLTGNPRIKSKLKVLSAELLSERIQNCGKSGHDPTEDAAACMKLVLKKLSKSIIWGNVVAGFERSDEEIVAAHTLLLQRDKEVKSKKGLKLAEGAIVRTHNDTDDIPTTYKQSPHCLSTSPTNGVAWFFFQPFIQRQTPCLIVGNQQAVEHFNTLAPLTKKTSLVFQTVESPERVVTAGRAGAPSLGLSLMYASLVECDVMKNRVEKLNGLVKKLKKKLEPGVILVVLLAGRRTGCDVCRESAAFMDLPLEEIPPVSMPEVP